MQAPFDWTVVYFCWGKGVFQQAVGFKHHTQRIYQQMALSAAEFLSSVVSAYPSDAGGLHLPWVSRIAALGWGSRPPRLRILSRNTAVIFSQVPSKRHSLK